MLGQTCCKLLPPGIIPVQMALLEAVGLPWKDYYFLLLLRSPIGPVISRVLVWLSGLLCQDSLESIAFRKSFIEQQVREFLQRNKSANPQVLILAAGYDTLSLRLAQNAEHRDVNFWEVDHPATGSFKERIWRHKKSKGPLRLIGNKPANLFSGCVDLTKKNSLVEMLRAQKDNYSVANPTIVVMEGLLMYLNKEQVHSVFDEISKAVGPGSVATFDMLATKYDVNHQQHPDVGFITPLVDFFLKIKGEPWLLGLDPEILQEFVTESDRWTLRTAVQSYGPERVAALEMGDAKLKQKDNARP